MIELDKKYNPQNSGTELDERLISSLPLPVYDAYRLLESESNYEKSLQVLCLSLIPWTYQYIALILSGEYLESSNEPSFEVTDSLLNMVKKPGPGKWIGFARVACRYFTEHETTVISSESISVLDAVLNGKNKPLVKVTDNDNRLEYSDALISVRNRFAHSRSFTGDKAKELFQDYFQIWKALIVIIKDIFVARLLFRTSPGDSYHSFDSRSLDIDRLPSDPDNKNTLLWNEESGVSIRLYPIVVTYSEDSKNGLDVAFLEEIRNKYLFYLKGDNFFKLKDEFEILSKIIDSKTVKEEVITAESLTLNTFAERIDRITNQTINDFRDALKYIFEIYLDRPSLSGKLDSWIENNLPGCIISGNPGTGKTSLVANLCVQRKSKGDHVLLFEASRLSDSDITSIIEQELNLGSPLKDCLDSIQKQNVSLSGDQKPKKFIIVIDAVNEFTGSKNENRSRLWREINSLVSILNLYNPYLKCLVTTRSDLWNVDFPEKSSAFDMLKEKLYWGETAEGFPRIMLGDLSIDEAGEIFEKARTSFPAMAVQNSFNELSQKTKKVLCNPFFLRLALITYNGRKVPDLTKSKIERQYAKEKITEEKDKTTVLFTLLERMSQLRKTEVTIDEFLYSKTGRKSKSKKAEQGKKDLEKLIYDPRPQSSYKKLIREGIIEERTEEGSIESKEKIRFSQEKITDIIYKEFQRRDLKRRLKVIMVFGLYLIIGFSIIIIGLSVSDKNFNAEIRTELSKNIPDQLKADEIYSISTAMLGRISQLFLFRYGLFILLIFIPVITVMILEWYARFYGARIIKLDLPSRFIKEKFTDLKKSKSWYGIIPAIIIVIILYVRWISKNTEINDSFLYDIYKPFIYGAPFLILYILLWDLLLGGIIVYKRAHSTNDAYCIFGKKEVIQSSFELMSAIPVLIFFFFSGTLVNKVMDINSDKKLIVLVNEWNANESASSIRGQNLEIYSRINNYYVRVTDKSKLQIFSKGWTKMSRALVYSICILFPFYMLIQYLTGFLLYKLLKRKL